MSLEPITREEKMLDAIAKGESVELTPITREELFLAKAGGADVITPTPITRKEFFLSKISGGGGGNDDGWIGDGNTHIWVHLLDGRTSPMLGCIPDGTVTVNWGDGTENDTLTGNGSNVKWTPTHDYKAPGNYVITLTVNGTVKFAGDDYASWILHYSSSADGRDQAYRSAITKVEIGGGVSIGSFALAGCPKLAKVAIPDSVTSIGDYAFCNCNSLTNITIPDSVTLIEHDAFGGCASLTNITIPDSITSIGNSIFYNCRSLTNIIIPNSIKSIERAMFFDCTSLTNVIIPNSVTSIGSSVFNNCGCMAYYDFTAHTSVPTLSNANAFSGIPADCEIRVPAALYEEWKAATNWSAYADHIVPV